MVNVLYFKQKLIIVNFKCPGYSCSPYTLHPNILITRLLPYLKEILKVIRHANMINSNQELVSSLDPFHRTVLCAKTFFSMSPTLYI